MRDESITYELEDKDGCPNCHHQVPLWLGFSGVDNEGLHVAYRCPSCGFETCDYLVSVDDVLPKEAAWSRNSDGSITWYPEVRAEHSVQADIAECTCEKPYQSEEVDDGVCGGCLKPFRNAANASR